MNRLIFELRVFSDLRNKMYEFLLFIYPLFTLSFVKILSFFSSHPVTNTQVFFTAIMGLLTYSLYASGVIIFGEKMNGTMELIEAAPTQLFNEVFIRSVCITIVSYISLVITFVYAKFIFFMHVQFTNPIIVIISLINLFFCVVSFGVIVALVLGNTRQVYSFQNVLISPLLLLSGIWSRQSGMTNIIGFVFPIRWGVFSVQCALRGSQRLWFFYVVGGAAISGIYVILGRLLTNRLEYKMRKEGRYNEFQ